MGTDDTALVREHVVLTAHPAKAGAYEFDFELRLEAIGTNVTLAGATDKGKSYGGALNVRFAPRERTVIRTESGVLAKDDDLHPHQWAELEASYGGKRAGLRITPDAKNPGFPTNGVCALTGSRALPFPARPTRYRATCSSRASRWCSGTG